MTLPKFILGDHSDFPTAIFIIHTEFPRFIVNLETDSIEWLEDFDQQDSKELQSEAKNAIIQATSFYDSEVLKYEKD